MLDIQTFETLEELDKWANYFRFQHLHETMTFEVFLAGMRGGYVAQRPYLDWKKVEAPHEQEELRCTSAALV